MVKNLEELVEEGQDLRWPLLYLHLDHGQRRIAALAPVEPEDEEQAELLEMLASYPEQIRVSSRAILFIEQTMPTVAGLARAVKRDDVTTIYLVMGNILGERGGATYDIGEDGHLHPSSRFDLDNMFHVEMLRIYMRWSALAREGLAGDFNGWATALEEAAPGDFCPCGSLKAFEDCCKDYVLRVDQYIHVLS